MDKTLPPITVPPTGPTARRSAPPRAAARLWTRPEILPRSAGVVLLRPGPRSECRRGCLTGALSGAAQRRHWMC